VARERHDAVDLDDRGQNRKVLALIRKFQRAQLLPRFSALKTPELSPSRQGSDALEKIFICLSWVFKRARLLMEG
jgi:hypothetical protein